jgi:prepilin-type N-terminal cleavage/methylation domain-containing protein
MNSRNQRLLYSGFTLLELSIVLIIIGLITGGVIAGQELMEQAQIRRIIKDEKSLELAVMNYQLKYSAMPGDHKNAYAYWPAAAGCASNALATTTDPTGCNGNGNGWIEHTPSEHFKAWTHMGLSGILPRPYSGIYATNMDYQRDVNLPVIGKNGFALIYYYSLTSRQYASGFEFNVPKHRFTLSAGTGLSVSEISQLDEKIDDGKAGLGVITVHSNSCSNQGVGGNTDAALFDMTDPNKLCQIDWVLPIK